VYTAPYPSGKIFKISTTNSFKNDYVTVTISITQNLPYNPRMTDKYPSSWRKANPRRPNALQSRITEQQKLDLYNRNITTRDLAKVLDVHEKHLSFAFPGKKPIVDKGVLIEARKDFKLSVAKEILEGRLSIDGAAKKCCVSYHTMWRHLAKAKKRYPELVEGYEQILLEQRKLSMNYARKEKHV